MTVSPSNLSFLFWISCLLTIWRVFLHVKLFEFSVTFLKQNFSSTWKWLKIITNKKKNSSNCQQSKKSKQKRKIWRGKRGKPKIWKISISLKSLRFKKRVLSVCYFVSVRPSTVFQPRARCWNSSRRTASGRSCWWLRLSWSTASSRQRRRWQSGKSNCIGNKFLRSLEIWPLFSVLFKEFSELLDSQNRSPSLWRWPWRRTRSSAASRWASTSTSKGVTVSVYSILLYWFYWK